MGDGRAAPGCGNLRQKRPLRKRKRKGGVEAEGRAEGNNRGGGRHLPWVSVSKSDVGQKGRRERERERERDEWKKSRGERAERVPGANRSMICSANSSLSNPLESCNRAPLILLPAFLPLNRSRWPLYLHPPSTNFPQIIPPSPISARPSLVTHCSEISPTLPLSCQPYLNQTPFAVSEPSSSEFTLFESRSKERKKRKEGTFFLLLYAFFLFSTATCSLAWVATLGSLPSPSSDQSSNEKVCIPLA